MTKVEEILKEVADGHGRFSKGTFSKLLTAIANEPEFKAQVAEIKNGQFAGYTDVAVGEKFRSWVRKVVEKAGVDATESAVVLSDGFTIPNCEWMYDMFAEAMFLYMENGGTFTMPKKEDFDGGRLQLASVAASDVTKEIKKPGSRESMGTFHITDKPYKKLIASSGIPKYLRERIRVGG